MKRKTRTDEATVVLLPGAEPPKRTGRRWALWLTAMVAAALSGFGAAIWTVQEIRVVGTAAVSADEVLAASGLEGGERLALTRLSPVAERVERLPAVRSVEVERALPARVVITVSERVPLARLDAHPELAVDAQGRMFTAAGSAPLPALAGWEGRAAPGRAVDRRARAALAEYARFPEALRTRTDAVHVGERFQLVLAGEVEVRFGEPRDLVAKAVAAEAVFRTASERGTPLAYIDVRTPQTPVVGEVEEAGGVEEQPDAPGGESE